uniref:Uncharacterized protein n=1 Tax=Vespula pensylvanica TaxID=30213 RepID=A0A834P912_VESPE|nr:hypothetical protein H0235_005177 [Vespula pensylvanica]
MCTVLPAYLILTTVDTTPIFFRETGKKIFYVSDADVSAVPGELFVSQQSERQLVERRQKAIKVAEYLTNDFSNGTNCLKK